MPRLRPAPCADDTTSATATRLRLLAGGYCPIPVYGKNPAPKAWETKTETNQGEIELWATMWPAANNTGILNARNPCLDIDILEPEAAEAVELVVRERFEEAGAILVRFGRSPKRAIFFRTDEPFKKIAVNLVAPNGDTRQKIEFLGDGQQVVVDGIHPDTGKPYYWHGAALCGTRREDLPYIREAGAGELPWRRTKRR